MTPLTFGQLRQDQLLPLETQVAEVSLTKNGAQAERELADLRKLFYASLQEHGNYGSVIPPAIEETLKEKCDDVQKVLREGRKPDPAKGAADSALSASL